MRRVGAIVLAAGESRRMGSQKLLLPFAGSTVVAHIVDQLAQCALAETVVVVGHDAVGVSEALVDRPIKLANNKAYRDGMLSSIRCALRACPTDWDGYLIALGDQPSVSPVLVNTLLEAFEAHNAQSIVLPTYEGRRGHPMIFPGRFREDVLTRFDDVGLRGLLQERKAEVFEIDVTDEGAVSDMDYPADYQRELDRLDR